MAVEVAALAAGKAVGERAVRTWLAARAAGESRDKPLIELMRARFPDQLVRRKAERQIEDIADSVTARVLKLCTHEYPGLDDDARQVVLAEVVHTLSRADLSDAALLAADADPVKLARSMPAPPRDLGEAELRLYEAVVDECCDCLVRIVRHLPEFQPRAAAEMLARLSGVGEQIAVVLDRLPMRTLAAPEGTGQDEEFTRRYLDHVSRTLDTLDLLGVRVERFRPRTTLSVAYVSLSVSAAARDRWEAGEDGGARVETVRVESALGQGGRMLVRGEAGGGKSTLLRWLAITAARGGFEEELDDWNGCVPYLVKLRSHADRDLPRPERLLDGVADPLAGLMPRGWAHRRLASGRALLLVDGVDELTGTRREAVKTWLRGMLAEFPRVKVVVTARPSAADSAWLRDLGFAAAHLEPMSPMDTRALIEHWHAAVRHSPDLPCPPSRLPAYEAALLARLEGAAHLRALATTPLLASMLCALNLDRETRLPRDRMGLYGAVLELLLERRDAERAIPAYAEVDLERAQKVQILQELAWRLSVTDRVELGRQAALASVAKVVAAMPRVTVPASKVLDYLLHRSGVLREPVVGRIDFVHRTVQEYLTARAAAEDGDMEPLIAHAHLDQWREVVVMAAGHANAPLREELLDGLLTRASTEPEHTTRLKLLVIACLETMPSVPYGLRERVDACLDELVPPKDPAHAQVLAMAGEVVLDRLPDSLDGLSPEAVVAIVRTAWMVNGPRALDRLAGYVADPGTGIMNTLNQARYYAGGEGSAIGPHELNRAWRYFDAQEFAARVLCQWPSDLALEVLHESQYNALTLLESLRHVTVSNLPVADLEPLLAHRQSLREVVFLPTEVAPEILRGIWRLRTLKALTVRLPPSHTDIAFLGDMPDLRRLSMHRLEMVTDWTPLRSLREIRKLNLYGAVHLKAWEDLPPLLQLSTLRLSKSPLAQDLGGLLARAPELAELRVQWADLRDITPLRESALHVLDLAHTQVSDLRPVSSVNELWLLRLDGCAGLSDLRPLAGHPRLSSLSIENVAPGIDLAPLAENKKLTVHIGVGQDVTNGHLLGDRLIRR